MVFIHKAMVFRTGKQKFRQSMMRRKGQGVKWTMRLYNGSEEVKLSQQVRKLMLEDLNKDPQDSK